MMDGKAAIVDVGGNLLKNVDVLISVDYGMRLGSQGVARRSW